MWRFCWDLRVTVVVQNWFCCWTSSGRRSRTALALVRDVCEGAQPFHSVILWLSIISNWRPKHQLDCAQKEERALSRRALLCGMIVVRSTAEAALDPPLIRSSSSEYPFTLKSPASCACVHFQLPFKCAQSTLSAFQDVTLIFQERPRSRGCGWWTALITRRSCRHANQDLTQKVIHCQTVDTFHVRACCEESGGPH